MTIPTNITYICYIRGAQDKVILAFVQINYSMINYLTDWESIIVLWQLGYH